MKAVMYLSYQAGILMLLLLVSMESFAQEKTELAFGVGIPEAINARLKFGVNNKVGISAGIIPDNYYSSYDSKNYSTVYTTLSVDFYHYFKNRNETVRSRWYFNSGISLWPGSDEKALFLYLRFGRNIYFSKKAGINLDLGVSPGILWEKGSTGSLTYGTVSYGYRTFVMLPSCSISFFVIL